MLVQGIRDSPIIERLEQHAPIMGVIILEPEQRQDRRANIGMVAEDVAEAAFVEDARAGNPEPGLRNLVLETAVVPGKARIGSKTARRILRWGAQRRRRLSRGEEEIIGIGEQD